MLGERLIKEQVFKDTLTKMKFDMGVDNVMAMSWLIYAQVNISL